MPYHLAMAPDDSDGNRTRVTAVKGRCLNRLTTEPYLYSFIKKTPRVGLEPTTSRLTAVRSTIELSRNISFASFRMSFVHSKLHTKSKNQTFLKAGHLDSASLHLDDFATQNSVCIKCHIRRQVCSMPLPTSCRLSPLWSSPRSISNSQLHVLPHFHLCPIYLVVFKGSYSLL